VRTRSIVVVGLLLLGTIVLQTTLFSQTEIFTPDLVMLLVVLLCLTRIRPELLLGVAFLSGLVVDLLGSAVLGLRAIVFTVVAYLALRTKDRADVGRVLTGVWAGLVSFAGALLLVVVGTLFGQTVLLGEGVVDRLVMVPLANLFLALIFAPMFVRMVDRDSTAFRYV
jgi:rod shape-determining protein MreD